MAAYDFSAPFVAARIILPSGDAFPLWTNVGGEEGVKPTVPGTKDLQALCFVQEIQVRLNLAGVPQISAQLSPPFEDGMRFLDSPLADPRMQNRIEVQLGYVGGTGGAGTILSSPYVASLQTPEVTVDSEIQITLKAQGIGAAGAAVQGGRVVGASGDRRSDIIERIAAGSGGNRRTLQVDFTEAWENSQVYDLLRAPASDYAQGGKTDWLALWELAQATRCLMNIVGPTDDGEASRLLWRPRAAAFSGPPTRRYRLYHFPGGQFRGETGMAEMQTATVAELPILSFSCNTEGIWGAVTYQDIIGHGIELNDTNVDTVKPSTTTLTVETEAPPVDSGEGAQTLPGTPELPNVADPLPGDPANEGAVRQASAEVETSAGMSVHCEIETLGDPVVTPGDVIALAGLGSRFDARVYHVYQVAHSIGIGGFSTNLTVQSNTDTLSDGNALVGQPNTADRAARAAEFLADDVSIEDDLGDLTGIQLDPR